MSKAAPDPEDDAPESADEAAPATAPVGATAAVLVEGAGAHPLIHVAIDERAAEDLAATAVAFDPDLEVLVFPPWDCLPYDRASPSLESQGRRVACLLALAQPAPTRSARRRLVVTSPEAVLQRSLPREALDGLEHPVALQQPGEVQAMTAYARRTGYRQTDEVAEPGAFSVRGEVMDIFPPSAPSPCRLEITDGKVTALRAYDAVSQLTTGDLDGLTLTPASELIAPDGDDGNPDVFPSEGPRPAGVEHDLPRLAGPLASLFDHLPDAAVDLAPGARERLDALAEQVRAAFETADTLARDRKAPAPPQPDALYLDRAGVADALKGRKAPRPGEPGAATPLFALAAQPVRDAARRLRQVTDQGGVAVIAGARADLRRLTGEIERRTGLTASEAKSWAAVREAKPGSLLSLSADLARGFEVEGVCVVAARDVLGARAGHLIHAAASSALDTDPDLRFGDLVIHEAHGVGVLRSLESVEADGQRRPAARLEYHDGAALLVPAEALRRVWRYGADADAVTLDRLNTKGWAKKRAEVEASIAATAAELVELARRRDGTEAPRIKPPRQAYERFAAGFPYPLTVDQAGAVAAVLEDLGSGRPMNRLVCGDVGFGKTEVALRAAAAVALSGRQVAVAAPTTVLARQHLETFRRRFARVGLEVGQLSRLAEREDARATKSALASGALDVVVGTHALAAEDVAFHDLGLLIVDEEQRFGAGLKAKLHAKAADAHVLMLTATPIPRTLQGALVGIQDISVMATPPVRRRPVRTLVAPYDPAVVKTALQREKARGGQSFVVAPRIEAIGTIRDELQALVPELTVVVAHGELTPEAVDEAMVRFADGEGDVLLATSIIESGLDVPRANTMLVRDPDRFGLAELHQLRGRVGRGRAQAAAYLLYDPDRPPSDAARARLQTLAAYDRLGAGLAISARDLDQRGAGDLVGEDQAGHLKLIGTGLYQWLLARAVGEARGEAVEDRAAPELALGVAGELPEDYAPDPEVRLNLYARLSRLESAKAVRAFADELEDRFGPLPKPARTWIDLARLGRLAAEIGVCKLAAGPKGVALDLYDPADAPRLAARRDDLKTHDGRLVWTHGDADLTEVEALLESLEDD